MKISQDQGHIIQQLYTLPSWNGFAKAIVALFPHSLTLYSRITQVFVGLFAGLDRPSSIWRIIKWTFNFVVAHSATLCTNNFLLPTPKWNNKRLFLFGKRHIHSSVSDMCVFLQTLMLSLLSQLDRQVSCAQHWCQQQDCY